jgi:hypothetical protein
LHSLHSALVTSTSLHDVCAMFPDESLKFLCSLQTEHWL